MSAETIEQTPETSETSEIPEATPSEEIEKLIPGPGEPVRLESGTLVQIKPLKLREFLALLKIVSRGAVLAMGDIRLNTNDPDFAKSMVALVLMSIPEADEEVIAFIRLVCDPHNVDGTGTKLTPDEWTQANRALDEELSNPEPEDVVTIIETLVHREAPDMRRLGKRMSSALQFAQKTGQFKNLA